MTFQQRTELGRILLLKQSPVTLQEARDQVNWLKAVSSSNKNKVTIYLFPLINL